jgi:hypothetical protein
MARGALTGTVTLLFLTPLMRFINVTPFRILKSLYFQSILFTCTLILVLFFQIIWIVEFTGWNSGHTSAFSFPLSTCHITLTFPLTLKTFLIFIYAQSELPLLTSFSRPGIYVATWKHTGLALSMTRRHDFQNSLSLGKLYWKRLLTMSLHPRSMLLCTSY